MIHDSIYLLWIYINPSHNHITMHVYKYIRFNNLPKDGMIKSVSLWGNLFKTWYNGQPVNAQISLHINVVWSKPMLSASGFYEHMPFKRKNILSLLSYWRDAQVDFYLIWLGKFKDRCSHDKTQTIQTVDTVNVTWKGFICI